MLSEAWPHFAFNLFLFALIVAGWRMAERDAREVREKHEGDPVKRALYRAEHKSAVNAGRKPPKRRWTVR